MTTTEILRVVSVLSIATWHGAGLALCLGIITWLSGKLILKGAGGDAYDFYNAFMGNATIRILAASFGLLIYFHFVKENQMTFAILFFVLYFLFTTFEIIALLSILQAQKKS